jgi:hypothetical protein
MNTEALYERTLHQMASSVHTLASRVPAPQSVPYRDGFVYRYVERTLHQALVQKLARMVSTLSAAWLLMEHGFGQEQASLQRVLDEIQEDITFLGYAVIFDARTQLHDDYLAAFFQEEFDADDPVESSQNRPMIPRKKIRAWIVNTEGNAVGDPSRGIKLSRTLHKTYSGYVHAASPHIMDMYLGDPPQFQMSGVMGGRRHAEHRDDLWNLFYRGILAFSTAAAAFGDHQMFETICEYSVEFARANGKDYGRGHAA